MVDSSSSQSQLSQPSRPARANRGNPPPKSLVHANVFSLRDLLSDFGDAFPNLLHLEAHNIPSKYKQSRVDDISVLFGIKAPYRAVAPGPNDRACYPKPGAIRMYKETFHSGFRLPPHPFVLRLLAEVKICPTQLMPNGWRFIYCFLAQCMKHRVEPSVSVFRYLFKFVNAPDDIGWVKIQYRTLNRSCFVSGSSPDSLPLWKKEWFYIYLDGDDWNNYFCPNFTRATDGSLRSLKLGVDDLAAIQLLTDDCLHHCNLLISEDNLQAMGLSTLEPRAKTALNAIFKRREDHASKAVIVEIDRPSKRKKAVDGSPAMEKVPAFLAERPVLVDEDPNPFVVKWGLLNRDTVVGDSRAAAEWSRNVVTPRDVAHVVESSEDLQIELLGAQALASANTYHQAALHNLKAVRAEKLIAERDRDRYFASSTSNFEMFRGVERELVDEKERVRQLEAQLQRGREDVIAEYRASKEFDDLLNAEYDANFPSTFKDCWESIIEELGTKIEGVSLDKFPVPDLSGASKDTIMDTVIPISQPIDDSELFLDSEPVRDGDLGDAAKDDVPLNLEEEIPQDDIA
ncbi:hypothetical protein POM88_011735 [Heracleum sosnowskyi]|uniref:Transposase (putative) gypsy type domain-containing protein n=1 Tax=Heracleum sosnowskyi TaxID=360622 RepID=A0AAD8IV32_9APIA|nr:hypothetical protein POM88_011735 [Heracleum sosnowskyi]